MGDKAPQEIRERVWVEKFDHEGAEPQLAETVFVEQVKTLNQRGEVTDVRTEVQTTREPRP